MKVKIFNQTWNMHLDKLEEEVNEFLATLPDGAIHEVQTIATAIRAADDQMETEYIVTVWYNELESTDEASAGGADTPSAG